MVPLVAFRLSLSFSFILSFSDWAVPVVLEHRGAPKQGPRKTMTRTAMDESIPHEQRGREETMPVCGPPLSVPLDFPSLPLALSHSPLCSGLLWTGLCPWSSLLSVPTDLPSLRLPPCPLPFMFGPSLYSAVTVVVLVDLRSLPLPLLPQLYA